MNTKYNNEDLLHNLPDYISDSLNDEDLKEAIKMKIRTDPDFKMELTGIKETLKLLEPELFELPSDTYFNNLSVRINEAINKETPALSFFERLGISLKLAIPVFALLLVITSLIIYNASYNESSIFSEKKIDETKLNESVNNIPLNKKPDLSIADNEKLKNNGSEQKESKTGKSDMNSARGFKKGTVKQNTDGSDLFLSKEKSVFSKGEEPVTGSLKANANEDLASSDDTKTKENISDNKGINGNSENTYADQEDDILITGDADDDFLEEDIFELTPEEQMEIVEYLKHS